MKCATVRTNLAGYIDDAIDQQRACPRTCVHSSSIWKAAKAAAKNSSVFASYPRCCPAFRAVCRPPIWPCAFAWPPRNPFASQDLPSRFRTLSDHAAIVLENVFRPLTVPATGGFISAILVFVVVLQLMVPGITVRAVQNDVPTQYSPTRRAHLAFRFSRSPGAGAARVRTSSSPRPAAGRNR